MKIAVIAQGRDLSAPIDARFGRAKFFVIADTETGGFSTADNTQNLTAAQGAGIQAGRNVVEFGVKAVITGHVDPKSLTTLQAGGVAVYIRATGSVADAIKQFKAGRLRQSTGADVEGHWV